MTIMDAETFLAKGGDVSIRRDGYGRPMVVPPGGGAEIAYSRCTTFIDVLDDKTNLEKWKMRSVAIGLALREDLLVAAAALGPENLVPEFELPAWKRKHHLNCEAAIEAARGSAKATIGTALHAFTEKLDRGQPLGPVPERWMPHIKAYAAATQQLTARHIEQGVVYDPFRIHGTPDRVVEVDGETGLFIADVKSGSVDYPHKMAMQLAVYSRSVLYDPLTATRTPMGPVRQDKGVIIALDQATGECQLLWIDLERGWEAVMVAAQVRQWRRVKDLVTPWATEPTIDMATGEVVMSAVPEAGRPVPVASPTGDSGESRPSAPVEGRHLTAQPATTVTSPPAREASFPLTARDVAAAMVTANMRDPATLATLKVAIQNADTVEDLYTLWRAAGTAWTPEFTQLSSTRKKELAG